MAPGAAVAASPDEGHHHEAGSASQLGRVSFPTTCAKRVQTGFESGVAMLHSFWYEQATKTFAKVIKADPRCAMAHWGAAMALFHQIWNEPFVGAAFAEGKQHADLAQRLAARASPREKAYIAALKTFYDQPETATAIARAEPYSAAMERLHQDFPADDEGAIFYALSLLAVNPLSDKSYVLPKKAGAILNDVLKRQPMHPGVSHYLIHSFDFPGLAEIALPAARAYAQIAPAVPHALHMPSHIFTRLGLWQDSIASNQAAAEAARKYAVETKMDGVWDQQLHAMDYLIYAYLQLGNEAQARKVRDEATGITKTVPNGQTAAYALAAIPARFAIERGDWAEAARLPVRPSRYPAIDAITYTARALGAARSGDLSAASQAFAKLEEIHQRLVTSNDSYWATEVEIQRLESAAVIALASHREQQAERLARAAVELESKTDKLNVTPGSLAPAGEILGSVLLELHRPGDASLAYEAVAKVTPNRRATLAGLARAREEAARASASR